MPILALKGRGTKVSVVNNVTATAIMVYPIIKYDVELNIFCIVVIALLLFMRRKTTHLVALEWLKFVKFRINGIYKPATRENITTFWGGLAYLLQYFNIARSASFTPSC